MAIYKSNEVFSGVHYQLWKIEEEVDDLREGLLLSDMDKVKAASIHHPAKLKEFFALRQLVKSFFGDNRGIEYNSNGKPFLQNSKIPISFSHTLGFAGILVGENAKIGLDLEVKRQNILRIAPRFMNLEENASLSKEKQIEHLLFYWGAKEVIVKIEDNKKLNFKNSISVSPFNYSTNCNSQAQLIAGNLRSDYDIIFENLGDLLVTCGIKKR